MRVAYLTGRYPGISHTFITREVKALRELGVEVETFSIWPTDRELLLTPHDEQEHRTTYTLLPIRVADALRAHLCAVFTRPRHYGKTIRRAITLRRPHARGWALALVWVLETMVLWDQCRRREIRHVHVHLNGTAPTVALLLASFADDEASGPDAWTWSMTVHGPSEFYDTLGEQLSAKVRAATFVICISDFARSQLMGLVEQPHWGKLRVVHCGVDPAVFDPAPKSGERKLRVLNVGRLVSVKGQAVLIEAVDLLTQHGVDVDLTLVGEGPTRAELEQLIATRGLSERARLVGAVGQDEILDYYRAANVFCMSSFAEGVPVVLMEAMAQEIPVVAPAIMGIPELVENGVSGLLTRPARADEIAAALAHLARAPMLRDSLGRNARKKVIAEFTIERSARELSAIFQEHLQESGDSLKEHGGAAG
ncbi:MAG TPA: glycosyltransferase family 4 protein [Solirubrobacteraceae bacterium]|nr:glycosyltransferase family 4 protein [Solirubrobacteraceae bacterium]